MTGHLPEGGVTFLTLARRNDRRLHRVAQTSFYKLPKRTSEHRGVPSRLAGPSRIEQSRQHSDLAYTLSCNLDGDPARREKAVVGATIKNRLLPIFRAVTYESD